MRKLSIIQLFAVIMFCKNEWEFFELTNNNDNYYIFHKTCKIQI